MVSFLLIREFFPPNGVIQPTGCRRLLSTFLSISLDANVLFHWVYLFTVQQNRPDVARSLEISQWVFTLVGTVLWFSLITDARITPYRWQEKTAPVIPAMVLLKVASVLLDDSPQLLLSVWIDTEYEPKSITAMGLTNLALALVNMVAKAAFVEEEVFFHNRVRRDEARAMNSRESLQGGGKGEELPSLEQHPWAIREFRGHSSYIFSIAMVTENQFLTTSGDGTIKLWNLQTGDCLRTYGGDNSDWDEEHGLAGKGHSSTSEEASPDAGVGGMGQLRKHTSYVFDIAVCANKTRFITVSRDGTAQLWSLDRSDSSLITFAGHAGPVFGVEIVWQEENNDNEVEFITCSADTTARLWSSTESASSLRTYEGHTDAVRAVTSLQGGEILATASRDRTVRLWVVSTGVCLRVLTGHSNYVFCISRIDDYRFVTGSDDWTAKLWDIRRQEPLLLEQDKEGNVVMDEEFSQGLPSYAVRTLESGPSWEGHTADINSVHAFTTLLGGSTFVLTGSWDKRIKLWDVETGQCLETFSDGHSASVSAICSTGSSYFLTGSWDSNIVLWSLPPNILLLKRAVSGTGAEAPQSILSDSDLDNEDDGKGSLYQDSLDDNSGSGGHDAI